MHDGWTYVLAAYAVTAVTFAVWFWMILTKLRRASQSRTRNDALPAVEPRTERARG